MVSSAIVFFCIYYLVSSASIYGLEKSELWLTTVAIVFVLYYGIIVPVKAAFFGAYLPSMIKTALRHQQDPAASNKFPFVLAVPPRPS